MGLLDKLTIDGSSLSINDGNTPFTNPLATGTSLHSDGTPGNSYSLNGTNAATISNLYAQYEDGDVNPLEQPSVLDINGLVPIGPLSDPGTPSINNTFAGGAYLNNLPEGGGLIGDTNVATPFG
jgi:hypothetical protein